MLALRYYCGSEKKKYSISFVCLYFLVFRLRFCILPLSSSEGDDHGNSTADTSDSSEKSTDGSEKPVHKWPIRPGVHVHVNGLHVLNSSSGSTEITGFSYGARHGHSETEKSTMARGTSTHDMCSPHNQSSSSSEGTTTPSQPPNEAVNNSNTPYFFVFPCPFLLLAILLILCFLPPHLDADTSNSNTNNTTTTTKVVKPKRNKLRKYTNTTKRLVFLVIFIIHDHDMCNSSCKTTKNEMVLQVWLLLHWKA